MCVVGKETIEAVISSGSSRRRAARTTFTQYGNCSHDNYTVTRLATAAAPLSATPSVMSVGRPTVLPRDPIFPLLLPTPPQPHPVPHQKSTNLDNVIRRRNLEKEMDELSDEENELEDMVSQGYSVMTSVNA